MTTLTYAKLHENLKFASTMYVNGTTITRSEKNRNPYSPYFITVENSPQGLKDWEKIKSVMKVGFKIRRKGRNPLRSMFKTGVERRGRGGIHQSVPLPLSTRFDVYLEPKKSLGIVMTFGA